MKLPLPSLEVQVWAVERVVGAGVLLALARHGEDPDPGRVLRELTNACGGGDGERTYWRESKGITDEQVNPTWLIPWPRAAEICQVGLTAGNVVAMALGHRRYIDLQRDPWQSRIPPFVPGGWETTCRSDPLAHDLIWWPAYCASTDLMQEAERDVFRRALAVLSNPDEQQMTLELSA